MALVSLLTWLPYAIFMFLSDTTEVFSNYTKLMYDRVRDSIIILFIANSLVNPILYIFRMPEFKRALVSLFRRSVQQQRQVQVFPLRAL